jgi:hypothetical protein
MENYFVIQDEERNGDEGYYQGACKGLMEIYNSYLEFDHLSPFNGSRRLT